MRCHSWQTRSALIVGGFPFIEPHLNGRRGPRGASQPVQDGVMIEPSAGLGKLF
jgi:hypothetical protein